jgi:hypothetical protein
MIPAHARRWLCGSLSKICWHPNKWSSISFSHWQCPLHRDFSFSCFVGLLITLWFVYFLMLFADNNIIIYFYLLSRIPGNTRNAYSIRFTRNTSQWREKEIILRKGYNCTYHSRFIAEASQIFLRDAHVLPKFLAMSNIADVARYNCMMLLSTSNISYSSLLYDTILIRLLTADKTNTSFSKYRVIVRELIKQIIVIHVSRRIIYYKLSVSSRVVSGTEQKNSNSAFLPWMS